jgi:hypothetical protein
MMSLVERLAHPPHRVRLDELRDRWFAVRIGVQVPGYGALACDMGALRKIRGALGAVLLRSASEEVRSGLPCPWDPPCACDVLFREQLRSGGRHGLPKPWVLSADRQGQDLIVTLTLFGFAADWAPAVSAALVEALVGEVRWATVQPALFLPRASVEAVAVRELPPIALIPAPPAVEIDLVTPLDAESVDARDRPDSILGRLGRRVSMLAAWQGCLVDVRWDEFVDGCRSLAFGTSGLRLMKTSRRSGRGRQNFSQPMLAGSLLVEGKLGLVWPLLQLAEHVHVGRGATMGFGRVAVRPLRDSEVQEYELRGSAGMLSSQ